MMIKQADKEYLIENVDGVKKAIDNNDIGELLDILDWFIYDDITANGGEETTEVGGKVQLIYDRIYYDNEEP